MKRFVSIVLAALIMTTAFSTVAFALDRGEIVEKIESVRDDIKSGNIVIVRDRNTVEGLRESIVDKFIEARNLSSVLRKKLDGYKRNAQARGKNLRDYIRENLKASVGENMDHLRRILDMFDD